MWEAWCVCCINSSWLGVWVVGTDVGGLCVCDVGTDVGLVCGL